MDFRRFAIVPIILAGGIAILVAYSSPRQARAAETTTAPAAQTAPSTSAAAAAEAPAQSPATAPASTAPAAQAAKPPMGKQWSRIGAPLRKVVIGSDHPSANRDANVFEFEVELINTGAAVNTVKLTDYYATVKDKKLAKKYAADPNKYDEIVAANPQIYGGHYSVLDPVSQDENQYLPYATHALVVTLPDGNDSFEDLDGRNWQVVDCPPGPDANVQTAQFMWTLYRDANFADPGRTFDAGNFKPFLTLVKTYTVRKKDYSISMSLAVKNLSDLPLQVAVDQYAAIGLPREDPREDPRQAAFGKVKEENAGIQPFLRKTATWASVNPGVHEVVGTSDEKTPTIWIGLISKFFGSMMHPMPPAQGASPWKLKYYVSPIYENRTSRTLLTGVTMESADLKPGDAGTALQNFDIYAGPKSRALFEDSLLYHSLNYVSTIDLTSMCTFSWLSLGMIWLLSVFSTAAFGNYGVAIIMLVILVRLVLHPLTKKSQVSMMRMQKLQPAIAKLKEKHGDDKEALQKEMMKVYKEQGMAPMLGCLPMFLQMPIWVALWSGLNAAVELRHAAFLPVWLTDLAAPDSLFMFPSHWPLVGGMAFNLLPLLVTLATVLQTKLNPQMMGQSAAATPEAQQQQKMMKFMMPVMMLFIFYSMPSGLTLYVMTSTFAGVAEQWVIRRHIQAREAIEAASISTVEAGKGFRGSRPKKPKGPMWMKRG